MKDPGLPAWAEGGRLDPAQLSALFRHQWERLYDGTKMCADIATARFLLFAEMLSAPVQWGVLAVALVGMGIVLFKPKFLKRDPLSRSPQDTSLSQQRSVERQMQNLLVELSEMSRQVTSTLDTRATKLDLLIREADEKIAVLTALQSNTSQRAVSPFRMDALPERSTMLSMPIDSTVPFQHNAAASPNDSTSEDSSPEDFTSLSPAPAPAPSPYDADARHAEVYLLADQGQSWSEIASQLRRPSGEIQLILALRPDSRGV